MAPAQTLWGFPGKEGKRNLPVTAHWADGYPHQLKENKERKDKNNRVRPWCLDSHNVKLLRCWESGEELPPGRGAQNNRERACGNVHRWGTWGHVGGSLYVLSCMCVRVGVCVYLWHMQQDHTVLLVCGISRFKIGPTVGGGQEQTAEREEGGRRRRRGEKGRRTHNLCVHSNWGGFWMLRSTNPPVNKRGEVSVVNWTGRCYGTTDGKGPSLLNCQLTHGITVRRRNSGPATTQTYKEA